MPALPPSGPTPSLPAFSLALPAPAMRPQAAHSRWLQRGHLQWVLKSPWRQQLQQPGMPGLSSVPAGPWPADHGREQGQRGLTPQTPSEVLVWRACRQGWGEAGAISLERCPRRETGPSQIAPDSTAPLKNLPEAPLCPDNPRRHGAGPTSLVPAPWISPSGMNYQHTLLSARFCACPLPPELAFFRGLCIRRGKFTRSCLPSGSF